MCYHNSLKAGKTELETRYNSNLPLEIDWKPTFHSSGFSYKEWPVITCGNPTAFEMSNWGLIPLWCKDEVKANELKTKTLNCKGETAFEKPSFRAAIKSKRCLIPSTGFFEWMHIGKEKIPFFIYLKNTPIFSLAGVYDEATITDAEGKQRAVHTFSIITVDANPLMEKIHNTKKRMPVILPVDKERLWIKGDLNKEEVDNLLLPFPEEEMTAYSISKLITSRKENPNVPEVIAPQKYDIVQGII
jgi:putative SOS response-associated peptidase YedK